MTGHVFHPGHAPLHGITVVVETRNKRTYVGRYDTEDPQGVHMLDAAVHDPAGSLVATEEFLRKCAKFGVACQHKHILVPSQDIVRISRLSEIS